GLPGVTVPGSAVLVMSIAAGWQVIDADAWSVPSLVVVTWAVLSYFVHSLAEVVAVMCTVNVPPAPAGRSTGPQDSVCAPLWLTEHEPGPDSDWESIVQVTPDPDPAGNGSLTVTPLAVPDPLFLTVTVTPIGSPASTDALSAVLVILIPAGWQVIDADAWSVPSLVVVTLAVLS